MANAVFSAVRFFGLVVVAAALATVAPDVSLLVGALLFAVPPLAACVLKLRASAFFARRPVRLRRVLPRRVPNATATATIIFTRAGPRWSARRGCRKKSRCNRSRRQVRTLLFRGGVEQNPGPPKKQQRTSPEAAREQGLGADNPPRRTGTRPQRVGSLFRPGRATIDMPWLTSQDFSQPAAAELLAQLAATHGDASAAPTLEEQYAAARAMNRRSFYVLLWSAAGAPQVSVVRPAALRQDNAREITFWGVAGSFATKAAQRSTIPLVEDYVLHDLVEITPVTAKAAFHDSNPNDELSPRPSARTPRTTQTPERSSPEPSLATPVAQTPVSKQKAAATSPKPSADKKKHRAAEASTTPNTTDEEEDEPEFIGSPPVLLPQPPREETVPTQEVADDLPFTTLELHCVEAGPPEQTQAQRHNTQPHATPHADEQEQTQPHNAAAEQEPPTQLAEQLLHFGSPSFARLEDQPRSLAALVPDSAPPFAEESAHDHAQHVHDEGAHGEPQQARESQATPKKHRRRHSAHQETERHRHGKVASPKSRHKPREDHATDDQHCDNDAGALPAEPLADTVVDAPVFNETPPTETQQELNRLVAEKPCEDTVADTAWCPQVFSENETPQPQPHPQGLHTLKPAKGRAQTPFREDTPPTREQQQQPPHRGFKTGDNYASPDSLSVGLRPRVLDPENGAGCWWLSASQLLAFIGVSSRVPAAVSGAGHPGTWLQDWVETKSAQEINDLSANIFSHSRNAEITADARREDPQNFLVPQGPFVVEVGGPVSFVDLRLFNVTAAIVFEGDHKRIGDPNFLGHYVFVKDETCRTSKNEFANRAVYGDGRPNRVADLEVCEFVLTQPHVQFIVINWISVNTFSSKETATEIAQPIAAQQPPTNITATRLSRPTTPHKSEPRSKRTKDPFEKTAPMVKPKTISDFDPAHPFRREVEKAVAKALEKDQRPPQSQPQRAEKKTDNEPDAHKPPQQPYPPTFPAHLRQDLGVESGLCTRPSLHWTIPSQQRKHLGRAVAGALAGYSSERNVVDKVSRVREFLAIPSLLLQTSDGRDWRKHLKRRLASYKPKRGTASTNELGTPEPQQAAAEPQTTEEEQQHHGRRKPRSDAERVALEVTTKTRAGYPGRGMDVFMRAIEKKSTMSDDTKLSEMRRLHPVPESAHLEYVPGARRVLVVSADELIKQACSLCRGRSPGVSGWTEELIAAAALGDQRAAIEMAAVVTDLVNDDVPEVGRELTMSRLIAIPKPNKPNEARPIGIGEALLKIASAIQLKKCGKEIDELFGDTQFVLREGGNEQIIHQIRADARGGKIVAALDATNAFNTVERSAIADALANFEQAAHLRGIFNATYHRESTLRLFNRTGFVDLISRRGVRQGDPLGPTLFALATLRALTETKRLNPSVSLLAFADDVFITGENELDVNNAITCVSEQLRSIGVSLNLGKTKIIGRDGDPTGLVILGAWCGQPGSTEAFLNEKLQNYKIFFDGLNGKIMIEGEPIRLPPDVAFAALVQAGHARWTYMARTHPPEPDVVSAHEQFDNMVHETLGGIAGVKDLPHHSKLIATLPIREGGLGLAPFKIIGPLAYKSSVGLVDAAQQALTYAFYDTLRKSFDKQLVDHVKLFEHKYASMWLRKFGALDDEACPVTHGFSGSLRIRLGLHLKRSEWKSQPATVTTCPGCGKLLDGIAGARNHGPQCANWSGGYGTKNRHNLLRDSLIALFEESGATVSRELQIGDKFMDLTVSTVEGKYYWFDVGVSSKEFPFAMAKKKLATYQELADQHDAEFHPLVFNTEAHPLPQTKTILTRLSCDFGIPMPRLMSTIVSAIISGNGLIVAKAEAHVRAARAKKPIRPPAAVADVPVPSIDCVREKALRSEDVTEECATTLGDPELDFITRKIQRNSLRSDNAEAGAAELLKQMFAENEQGAIQTDCLLSNLPDRLSSICDADEARDGDEVVDNVVCEDEVREIEILTS